MAAANTVMERGNPAPPRPAFDDNQCLKGLHELNGCSSLWSVERSGADSSPPRSVSAWC